MRRLRDEECDNERPDHALKQLEALAAALALNREFTVSNRWLRSMLQGLSLQTARYTRVGLADPGHRRESARYWRNLLKTLRAGDAERAEKIASENSLASRDAAIRYLESTQSATQGVSETKKLHQASRGNQG